MAYSDDRKLRQRTSSAARALGVSAIWETSKKPIDMADDFIYELYVLFCLITELKSSYKVRYDPGVGKKLNRFPRKPADKVGRPKFVISAKDSEDILWQICAGTKIVDIVKMERAPDISVQKGDASDTPDFKDVLLIWDAKYKYKSKYDKRISHSEISSFGRWLDLLEIKNGKMPDIKLKKNTTMVANCLVTNGQASTEPNAERIRLGLKEVFNFYPGEKYAIIP